ncbi:hypothetical protein V6N13_142208 [Hibiscus sabdariffa]
MEVEEIGKDDLDSGAVKLAASTRVTKDGTTTYATMVAKPDPKDGRSRRVLNFMDEEVVVLDEDCLVDESEDCSVGREAPNEVRVSGGGVGLRLEADGSLSYRYGPWMVAANRRRRYAPPNSVAIDSGTAKGLVLGSRFASLTTIEDDVGLEPIREARCDIGVMVGSGDTRAEAGSILRGKQVVQDNGMKFNKSYMASNPMIKEFKPLKTQTNSVIPQPDSYHPKRQSKVGKGAPDVSKAVEVVSLVEGVVAEGVSRDVSAKVRNHTTVTVTDDTHFSKVSNQVGEGSSKQHIKLNRGLRIMQPLGVHSSSRVPVTGWLPGMSAMINDEAWRMQHGWIVLMRLWMMMIRKGVI